jgi:8-oxo-dGTP pyrophosphatase MutT (NUDIX family)
MELAAAIILREHDHRILLLHNIKYGLRIEPPGGKRKADESFRGCATRETLEETGLVVEVKELVGVYRTHSPEGVMPVHMFYSEIIGGSLELKEPTKHSGFEWYTMNDLYDLRDKKLLVPNMCLALSALSRRVYLE